MSKVKGLDGVKELDYLLFRLPIGTRLLLFGLCAFIGAALQFLLFFPFHTIVGFVFFVAAGFFMLGASYTKAPKDLGFEEWKPVTFKEFKRVENNFELVKTARLPIYLRKKAGRVFFIILASVSLFFLLFVLAGSGNYLVAVILFDLILMFYPLFMTGNIHLHTPKDLKMKMDRFHGVVEGLGGNGQETKITPYFRFDKDSEGRLIPEDVRLMIESKRKPADLIGAQLQVSINNGPKGAVPYMYAVILTKRGGKSFERLQKMDWTIRYGGGQEKKMVTENGSEDEFAYLVVRQPTGGGGYHTTESQCIELARLVLHGMRLLS